jgi:hypothetical protein
MQSFDHAALSQEQRLGQAMSFAEAVTPAQRLIGLYRRLSLEALDDLSDQVAGQVRQQADADFNRLQAIMDFDPSQGDPGNVRANLINEVVSAYDQSFNRLHPVISYGVSKSTDFQGIETEARATIQRVHDRGAALAEELEKARDQAGSILEEVRRVAAEQGVTQQARYFKEESDRHREMARLWERRTYIWGGLLLAYAAGSLFMHLLPALNPDTLYRSIALITSKILVFAVLSYMVYLCARNFLSHEHNEIVNRHRQNALMTFQALVDAAGGAANKDVILMYAASCIFSAQDTGYSRPSVIPGASTAKSIVELVPKPSTSA